MSVPVVTLLSTASDTEIRLLGPPVVLAGSVEREVGGRQSALLAALALNARRPVSVDRLIDVMWGERPPRDAANALQQRISRLRSIVDPTRAGDVLVQVASGYALHVDDDQIDVRTFEALAAAGRSQLARRDPRGAAVTFTKALGLWRGVPLEGFADEPWAIGESRRLEELRLAVVEDRFEALLGQGIHDDVIADLADLTVAHPLRERLRFQLMLALYRAGRQAEALAVYDEVRRLLVEELGVDPGPELQRIHHRVLTQDPGLTVEPARSSPQRPGNLPAGRSSIVGRDQALRQVDQLLERARLLTVTGPGGAGKTTLAVEAARRRGDRPDGKWLVELAPVATGDEILVTVADELGFARRGLGGGSVDVGTIVRGLAAKDLLLVLDNCEHLLDAVRPLVEEVLAAAPHVQILATSREPLSLAGEVVWSVPGLGVPLDEDTTADRVIAAPAVQLLVERARAHTPEFVVSDDTAAAAASLTRRLDGIPLAIELAAARLRVLSLEEVDAALDDRFRLLATRGPTAASRHRTLRAALDWSWDLLDPPLQRALTALSVPVDRFDLPMASELVGAVAIEAQALDVIADLVDRSLLEADTAANPTRYRMLESVREYGRERLAELGLTDAAYAAHADRVERELRGCHIKTSAERFGVAVEALATWLDEARVSLRWADGRGDTLRVQRIAGLLGWLWLLHGQSNEGLGWLDRGLGRSVDVDPDVDDATALLWASALRAAGTHTPDGRQWAEPALRAARTPVDRVLARVCAAGHEVNAGHLDDAVATLAWAVEEAEVIGGWPLGFVRLIAGQLEWASGHPEQARRHAAEAVELLGAAGARWGQMHALETLIDDAIVHGDHQHARELARQALELCREQRYSELEAVMLTRLGVVSHELGEDEEAAQLLEAAVDRASDVGSGNAMVEAHIGAGSVARRRGDVDLAREHLRHALKLSEGHAVLDGARVNVELAHAAIHAEQPDVAAAHAHDALALARRVGDPRALVRSVEALAGAEAVGEEPHRAIRLLATAAAVRDDAGITSPPSEQHDIEQVTERLRTRIDHPTFDRVWSAARAEAAGEPAEMFAQLVEGQATGHTG